MTAVTEVWVTTRGWARAHLARPAYNGAATHCGKHIRTPATPAPPDLPHCRTCQRTLT